VALGPLVAFAASGSAAEKGIVLVRDGRAIAKIVTAPDIERPFDQGVKMQAVCDLVRIVAVMSGAALPVVQDTLIFQDGPQIHLGMTEFVKRAGLIPGDLPKNGYRIVLTREGNQPRLVIAGPTMLGTSHGIYDLLTRELGVMWGMENSLFEEIPRRRTIALGPVDRTARPAFIARRMSGPNQATLLRHRLDADYAEERSLPALHLSTAAVPPGSAVVLSI